MPASIRRQSTGRLLVRSIASGMKDCGPNRFSRLDKEAQGSMAAKAVYKQTRACSQCFTPQLCQAIGAPGNRENVEEDLT